MEIQKIIEKYINEYTINIKELSDKVNLLDKKVSNLECNLQLLSKSNKEHNNNEISNSGIVELKKESIEIDNENIKKAILYKDYRSILYIFKIYYKNKTNSISQYPIKMKSKRIFEYFNNNQWIVDNNAHYIKNTLFMNIQTIFYKYNNLDNITDVDDLYSNQIFINKLSDDKYKRELFKHIVDEIQSC